MNWWRRFLAFVIDGAIIELTWSVIDNLIVHPIPEHLLVLGHTLWFCIYFGLTEGFGARHASLGKRVTGLIVIRPDHAGPGLAVVLVRALIVVFLLEISEVPYLPGQSETLSVALGAVLGVLVLSLYLINLRLLIWGPEGTLAQDVLTGTRVIHSRVAAQAPAEAPSEKTLTWRAPAICVAISVLFVGVIMVFGERVESRDLAEEPLDRLAESLKNAIAAELDLRSDVQIDEESARRTAEGDPRTRIDIEVRVPYAAVTEAAAENIRELVGEKLRSAQDRYRGGQLWVGTGFGPLRLGSTFETMP